HRPERSHVSAKNNTLLMEGQLDNGIDGKGMRYMACIEARLKEGTQHIEKDTLIIRDATEVILYVSLGTDWKNPGYKQHIRQIITTAQQKPYAVQRQIHI